MKKITVIGNNPQMQGVVKLAADVVFSEPDGEKLAMYILKPEWKAAGKGFPLVVFLQGSGWMKPDQLWQMPQLSRLAERGFVVASVTHRSCFTAPAPAFLKDVKTAIRFLRAHAEEYDIDKERVCIWGTSSGGNTALMAGMTGDDPEFEGKEWSGESSAVQAVVDCFGPTDLMKMVETRKDIDEEIYVHIMNALGGGCTPEAMQDRLNNISPMLRAVPGKKFPPMLILHGDADELVLYEDSEAFFRKMEECGYDVDMVRVAGAPHEGNFWSTQLYEIIFDFIQKQIG